MSKRHSSTNCFPETSDLAIEVIDELIEENLQDGKAEFKEECVRDRLLRKGLPKDRLPKKGLHCVVKLYQNAGWQVSYHRPIDNNNTGHYFVFIPPTRQHKPD